MAKKKENITLSLERSPLRKQDPAGGTLYPQTTKAHTTFRSRNMANSHRVSQDARLIGQKTQEIGLHAGVKPPL